MSRKRRMVAVDCETEGIQSRPDYPPKPVGYAIRVEGRRSEYLAFGHPSGNNCTRAEANARVKSVLREHTPVFHNADYDIEVLEKQGIKVTGEYHDTMRLAFINEPRSMDLGLKPQAEAWLGVPPEEQSVLKNWIIENIPEAKRKKSEWGNYICKTPGKVAAPYAKGDVDRTLDLFFKFSDELERSDSDYEESRMVESYKREMKLVPIKLKMEQVGIRVRLRKLKKELPGYQKAFSDLDNAIRKRLKQAPDFNVGSAPQLAKALVDRDLLSAVTLTATGRISTKRANLMEFCTDKKLMSMLAMRGTLKTYLSSFMENWVDRAERNDGYVQPTFNTVRRADEFGEGGKTYGARTGRFSSSDPNFQNIPANADESAHKDTLMELQKLLRTYGVDFIGLRDYFEPDEGCVFLRRDYDQQELRILAHREGGAFLKMYETNARMDAHDAVKELVRISTGVDYPRKHIKQTNFGILYGMGISKLAGRLGIDIDDAKILRKAVLKAIPGVKDLMDAMKELAARDEPFFTWGGRRYYCEDPIFLPTDDGGKKKITFEYKMLNTDIQGSAADCTKEGMIQVEDNLRYSRIVLQVHDELLVCAPKAKAREEMARMREAMEDVQFRVPMLSSGETGGVSWARMQKVKW